jgi:MSHA biogenesis protein MshQ
MTLTGASPTAINGSPANGVGAMTPVSMTFNANGEAPFTFSYADVGQITLVASKPAGGMLVGALNGTSNAFVVRPAGFVLSNIRCSNYAAGACAITSIANPGNNPGAASASGTAFMPAGAPFSATVTAIDASGGATPNYGRESPPQGATLTATLVQPVGGNAPAIVNPSAFAAFSGGSATGTTFAWPEVGIVTLRPSVAGGNYLGTGDVVGTASGNVGRFVPHHFDVTVTPACGAFSYAGQPFNTTITARNALVPPGTTVNYDGAAATPAFAKSVNLSDAGGPTNGNFGAGTSVPASAFVGGMASAAPSYDFTQKATAPRILPLRAIDADGVSSSGFAEGSTLLRSGRLRLGTAFGSEKSALTMPVRAEYWSGSSWLLNGDDSCTTVPATAIALSNRRDHKGSTGVAWSNTASAITLAAGLGTLTLGAPSPTASGTVDVALNLGSGTADQSCLAAHPATTGAVRAWLRSLNGSCAATADRDPSARASFGIHSPETQKTIHARELY